MPSRYHLSLNDPREPFLVGTPNKVWFKISTYCCAYPNAVTGVPAST